MIRMKSGDTFREFILVSFLQLVINACKKNNYNNPSGNKTPGLQLVTDSLVAPVAFAESPDNTKRLFIVDEIGKIWIVGAEGKKLANPFIDVSNRMVSLDPSYDERGLLGLAFHPDYKTNGKFYLFYTAPPRPGTPVPGGPGA